MALLLGPLSGANCTDRAAAGRITKQAGHRRLADRTRARASQISVRLIDRVAALWDSEM